jgi:gamma-glutamyltranspeptidase/glutathione hydrolase
MPPPSSGGLAMLQVIGMLERIDRTASVPEHNSADYIHRITECFKYAFADRARYLADPAFADVPVGRLLSGRVLNAAAALFDPVSTHPPEAYGTPPERSGAVTLAAQLPDDAGTSHFSVVDEHGNAVACTETVNLFFGSLVGVDEYGFVLNDEMDDFLTRRGVPNAFGLTQSEANLPEPGKRPLSSMSPTIVLFGTDDALADAQVAVVGGASGGPRIITGTMQAILNVILFDMTAAEAVEAARFHHQWMPNTLGLEPSLARDRDLIDELEERGHNTQRRGGVGVVQLIRRAATQAGTTWQAASDSRKGGAPAGY